MSKQLFIVTDLGGGDGGKGGIVHKLCLETTAHTVIKVGGAQGSHGVKTAAGQSFAFSHFGCGTLEGCHTHISNRMIIDPGALIEEAELLIYQLGIRNIFNFLTVDETCLCNTPYHRIASQLREMSRKDKPKGTIGTGVGEAVIDAERFPNLAITVRDIKKIDLPDKLEAVRQQKLKDLMPITEQVNDFWETDKSMALNLISVLQSPKSAEIIAEQWQPLKSRLNLVPPDHLGNKVLSQDGTAIVESSHGILTDRYAGFHPHTTQLRTLPKFTHEMIREAGYNGKIVNVGVTRAYQIRHGAGPMVTEDETLLDKLLPGSSKEENRWQGKVRVGPLDMVALRYAINCCGGAKAFNALAVTWFDQIKVFGQWPVCHKYLGTTDRNFFSPDGEIKVSENEGEEKLQRQKRLGEILNQCQPEVDSYGLPADQDGQVGLCQEVLQKHLQIPVRMISLGPTEDDKICF